MRLDRSTTRSSNRVRSSSIISFWTLTIVRSVPFSIFFQAVDVEVDVFPDCMIVTGAVVVVGTFVWTHSNLVPPIELSRIIHEHLVFLALRAEF